MCFVSIVESKSAGASSANIVQMIATKSASVGTSAYVVSKSGVKKLLDRHKKLGFTEAIPNIMAELFPETRFAAYPNRSSTGPVS